MARWQGLRLERIGVIAFLLSGALAGSTLPLPRPTHALRNSIDAVADRDFALDYLYACAMLFGHLSRIGEEIVLWTTSEFGFAGLTPAPSRRVRPPRVAESPAAIECKWLQTVPLVPLGGGEPANFLDVGGGANKEKVQAAFKIILSDCNSILKWSPLASEASISCLTKT